MHFGDSPQNLEFEICATVFALATLYIKRQMTFPRGCVDLRHEQRQDFICHLAKIGFP
jgi:hypothetical protein